MRLQYDLWTLRKNDSSTPKIVLQNTSERTRDYLRYVTSLIYTEALFHFEGQF